MIKCNPNSNEISIYNNEGNKLSWKWISDIIEDFDKGFEYPNGKYGYYGFWSSEMTDVDNDGNVDLILGGSYKDKDYEYHKHLDPHRVNKIALDFFV